MAAELLPLPANRPADRFYRGGARIAAFRGQPLSGEYEPEDWIASVTAVAGEPGAGRTVLPDGRLLSDAIAADPEGWLGPRHVRRYGADPMLLVKLLDAGQRLPVHAHPDGRFARAALGHAHGKAEAWYVLEGGVVHLGLRRDIAQDRLGELVARQGTAELLELLHEIAVAPGDVVFVPPGVLHAIGEGVFVLEVQEPEDLSILLEWEGFALDGATEGHLGIGFARALDAVETTGRRPAEIGALVRRGARTGTAAELLPPEAASYFRLERCDVRTVHEPGEAVLAPGFAVVVGVSGDAVAQPERGSPLRLRRGTTAVLPHAAGAVRLEGAAELLVARPPSP